ncbi:MAG: hypothetical protein VKI81_04780 [Synechococcaceae cyanobacterium]|nr:hypothetical protein [Synechococcaceae cyanobacterium]
MTVSTGSLVALADRSHGAYQVVNVDEFSDCVWVRRWPLEERRSPTFGVPIEHVRPLPPQVLR